MVPCHTKTLITLKTRFSGNNVQTQPKSATLKSTEMEKTLITNLVQKNYHHLISHLLFENYFAFLCTFLSVFYVSFPKNPLNV